MKKVIISFLVLISLGTLSACIKKNNGKMNLRTGNPSKELIIVF